MMLELTDKERQILTQIVDSYLPELRTMIASGVGYDLRIDMKNEEEIVKSIINKLHQEAPVKRAA